MIEVDVVRSPGWWLKVLAGQLHERRYSPKFRPERRNEDDVRPSLNLLNDYARNEPPLLRCAQGWGEKTAEFVRLARMNYAGLVLESVANRLMPIGWRTSVDSDRDGDQEAKRIADRNRFEMMIPDVITGMLKFGDSYMLLGAPRQGSEVPSITAEDARDCITAEDPRTGETIASLKIYRDDWDKRDYAYVFVGGRRYVAFNPAKTSSLKRSGYGISNRGWNWDDDKGGSSGEALPATLGGRNPMVRFPNRDGVGEYERHLPVLDRINDGIFDRIVLAKHQAHRQRALKNLPKQYPDDHELAGEDIEYDRDAFSSDPGALWDIPGGAEIWESAQTDLGPIRLFVKDDVEALAAVTFTPLHYINPDAANGSAEGATTMREGHIFRVEDRSRRAGAALAEVLSLAFASMGDQRRADGSIKTIWGPFERHSLEQKASAASQAGTTLPNPTIRTDIWGYAPADLPRLEEEDRQQMLFAEQVAAVSGG